VTLKAAAFVLASLLVSSSAAEERAPSDATVFIRVVGKVRAEFQRAWKESVEARDVEIATGSGFVFSPSGYVLTNDHVVSGEDLTLERNGQPIRVKLDVEKVEVVFPADGTRLQARVEATDAALDLAVLSINGADLPFIAMGDSDALQPGQPIQVLGYPFGRAVEVGRAVSAETVPQPTVSRGTVAGLRASDAGEARYIQMMRPSTPAAAAGRYGARYRRLGTAYSVEGAFASRADGLLQLEVESPDSKLAFVQDLFAAWLKAISGR
jgi:S1-C subfamily serine protease